MIRTTLRTLLAVALLLPPAWAQEAAVTRRPVQLRDAPGDQARSIASLPAQSPVTRGNERQGPWVKVTAGTATGWLHLFDIGPASASDGSGVAGGAMRSITSLFGGGASPQRTASTAGIRGLGAEDIANASPDPAAVTRMEAQRQSDRDVRSFAERAGWKPVAVEPLPEPSRLSGSRPASPGHPGQQESP
jgi:hypothetical protein